MKRERRKGPIVGLLALAVLTMLGGCRATSNTTAVLMPLDDAVAQVSIFRSDGSRASWADLVEVCVDADAVLVGETHGHRVGLSAAAALWRDLLARADAPVLLMEFYERDRQGALDDYLTGVIDDTGLDKAAHRTKGNNPPGHRAMIEAAKTADRPVIAANAPRRYVSLARNESFERLAGLTPLQQQLFVIPDPMPGGGYRDRFFEMMSDMGGHGEDEEEPDPEETRIMVEGFFRSQSVWDATMADSVRRAIDAGARPAVLIVGRFHVEREGGTVQMLTRTSPPVRLITLVVIDEAGDDLAEDDLGRADFILYAGSLAE